MKWIFEKSSALCFIEVIFRKKVTRKALSKLLFGKTNALRYIEVTYRPSLLGCAKALEAELVCNRVQRFLNLDDIYPSLETCGPIYD